MFIIPLVAGLLLFCLRAIDAAGDAYGNRWSYDKTSAIGPSKWHTNFSDCGGDSQSPINILTKHVEYNKDLKQLKLINYDETGSNVYFEMKNRNTDIAFLAKVKDNTTQVPQCVSFQGTTYRFYQFHFHWGAENFKGSEHQLDSQRFAAEMHMIHYNTKYNNISAAVEKSDGLLVWGHFLKVDSTNLVANTNFQKLLDHFSKAKLCCNTTKVTELNLQELLPVPYSDFYTYKGSLTTPGCHQSVRWIVNRNTISMSENQMKLFRQLKDNALHSHGIKILEDNFRPTQPLNGRKVERNFEYGTSSADVPLKPSVAILTVAAVFMFAL